MCPETVDARTHPDACSLLYRDVENIERYFMDSPGDPQRAERLRRRRSLPGAPYQIRRQERLFLVRHLETEKAREVLEFARDQQ